MSAIEQKTSGGEIIYKPDIQSDKNVAELYNLYDSLQNAEDITKHEEIFKKFISIAEKENTDASAKAKILAAQFIAKFLKHYPQQNRQALNAIFDLIEDDKRETRIRVIHEIPEVCQGSVPNFQEKTINVTAQLLLSMEIDEEDPAGYHSEIEELKRAFLAVMKLNPKLALVKLLDQCAIAGAEGQKNRERTITFLKDSIIFGQASELIIGKPEIEQAFADKIKGLMPNTTPAEAESIFKMLGKLSIHKTEEAKANLVQMISSILDLENITKVLPEFDQEKPLNDSQKEYVQKCLSFGNAIKGFLRPGVRNPFFVPFFERIVPLFPHLEDAVSVGLLKLLAETCTSVNVDDIKAVLKSVYKFLHDNLKIPVEHKNAEGKIEIIQPIINYSYLECILYIFHVFAFKVPGMLSPVCGIKILTGQPGDMDLVDRSELKNDFTKRLGEIRKGCTEKRSNFQEQLRKENTVKPTDDAGKKEKNEKINNLKTRLKLLDNVVEMCSKLEKKEPAFVKPEEISLSWKKRNQKKRLASSAFNDKNEAPKKERRLYEHPNQSRRQKPQRPSSSKSSSSSSSSSRPRGGRRDDRRDDRSNERRDDRRRDDKPSRPKSSGGRSYGKRY